MKDIIRIGSGITLYYGIIAFLICCQVEVLKYADQYPFFGGAVLVFVVALLTLGIVLLTTKKCECECECEE